MNQKIFPISPYASISQKIWMRVWWFFYEHLKIPKSDRYVFERLIPHLDSPRKVQAWMHSHLKYGFDIFDRWQTAEETFNLLKGDCEDWAIFANACLKDKYTGIFVLMYMMDGEVQRGHMTYMVYDHDRDVDVSVGTFGLMYHRESDIGDRLYKFGFRNWTKYKVLDEDMDLICEFDNNES